MARDRIALSCIGKVKTGLSPMNHLPNPGIVVPLLLLVACSAAGGWTKPGADAQTTRQAYHQCAALAEPALKTEAGIDQDILATRRGDWQRARVMGAQTQMMRDDLADRRQAIIDRCMRSKGFAKPG